MGEKIEKPYSILAAAVIKQAHDDYISFQKSNRQDLIKRLDFQVSRAWFRNFTELCGIENSFPQAWRDFTGNTNAKFSSKLE